ncbi:MAG: SAM-dependent methyltransferase [Acidobacteriota bacterium]|nr:SAM-dependent methyltransferase [Acidobacteriota bacterium]
MTKNKPADEDKPYASRGGLKLEHALREFGLPVEGLRCADLGASTGGFTDCLLRHGAAEVTAVETGYGVLDYRLRIDPRVVVRERTNALHAEPPEEPVDLLVVDLSWTRQAKAVPAALRWVEKSGEGRIVSLVKPHYEVTPEEETHLDRGVLPEEVAEEVHQRVLGELPQLGVDVLGSTRSPILGGKGKKRGNVEYLVLLAPARES